MKKVSGAAFAERHDTGDSIMSHIGEAQYTNALPDKKVSVEILAEEDILIGCPRCEIHSRLRKYNLRVRDGKMRRVVIDGTPFYVSMGAAL